MDDCRLDAGALAGAVAIDSAPRRAARPPPSAAGPVDGAVIRAMLATDSITGFGRARFPILGPSTRARDGSSQEGQRG